MLFFGIIAFVSGVAILQWFVVLPSLFWPVFTSVFLFLMLCFLRHVMQKIAIVLFLFSLGFTWAAYQANRSMSLFLLPRYFVGRVRATGWVESIPKKTALGLQFRLRLKTLEGEKQGGLLKLSWYRHYKNLEVGDQWHFSLKLKRMHGLINPDAFDYQRWAFQQGIVAKGYVLQGERVASRCKFPVLRYRAALQAQITSWIKNKDLAATLTALTIGSKALVSSDAWQVFQRTGTSHLIAISGLHVGLVATIAYFLMCWLWRFSSRLLLRIPAQRAGALAAIIVSFLYGLLVGFSIPTERAVIMVVIVMLSQLFVRHVSLWYRMLLAFVIVIGWQPIAIFSASFWLSFFAVFWIAYSMIGRSKRQSKIAIWLRVQTAIFLGLLPLTLFYFHQFSLVSFFANAVAVPWVTMVLVPLCLLASVLNPISSAASHFLFVLAAKALLPLWYFLIWLSHYSYAVWVHPIHSIFVVLSVLIATLCLLAPKGFPLRYLAVVFYAPFFFSHYPAPKAGGVFLTLLDVGQGLSAVVRTAHHTLVYDTGPKYPTGFDAGRSVVMPFLQDMGIKDIDTMMISHGDNDHIGGAAWLLSHYSVKKVITSVPSSQWKFKKEGFSNCYAGQSWRWDGVDFHVLSPLKGRIYQDNDSSCVLRIQIGRRRILLTGDIGKSAERALLKRDKKALAATLLVVPHHGSRHSSSLAFVKAVGARYVLIPVGYQNRFHFPAESVLKRYRDLAAQIFSTAKQGAIRIRVPLLGAIRVKVRAHREHYWQN